MIEVRASTRQELGWLCEESGLNPLNLSPNARGVSAVQEGQLVGVVAYDQWCANSVQAHMAVKHPAVWRRLLGPAFRFPFLEAGVGIIHGVVPGDNLKSALHCHRMGFKLRHVVKDGIEVGVDALLFEMRREYCRWLEAV